MSAQTNKRKPGRPRKVTPKMLEQIDSLRKENKTWNEIGKIMGLPRSTVQVSHRNMIISKIENGEKI